MTHFHWDHIQGIPFFAPLYSPANHVTFHSSKPPAETAEILEGQMTNPYFPVRFDLLAAKREFVQIADRPLEDNRLRVHAFPLNHPQGAPGIRLESPGPVGGPARGGAWGGKKTARPGPDGFPSSWSAIASACVTAAYCATTGGPSSICC